MNYAAIYSNLINRAINRVPGIAEDYECHHIIPRSEGGKDTPDNLVYLTIKEHYLAHLLLFNMGYPNQIFSVKAFLDDSINLRSPRFGLFRWKKWLRRAVSYQYAKNLRETARASASTKYLKRLKLLNADYELTLAAIEERYAVNVTNALFDTLTSD